MRECESGSKGLGLGQEMDQQLNQQEEGPSRQRSYWLTREVTQCREGPAGLIRGRRGVRRPSLPKLPSHQLLWSLPEGPVPSRHVPGENAPTVRVTKAPGPWR